MQATETHRARAAEIVAAAPLEALPVAQLCARQGDVILQRNRDLTPAEQAAARSERAAILCLAVGSHGSHFLMGSAVQLGAALYAVADGAVVVHTDEPAARHGSFRLAAGAWTCRPQIELEGDQVVEVRD